MSALYKKGFTLIELLVVIAIISLLSSIVIGSVNQARITARNSKRVQDLVQVRNALELYKLANGQYPVYIPINTEGFSCWDCDNYPGLPPASDYQDENKLIQLDPYLKPRPTDSNLGPSGNNIRGYWYKSDNTGTNYKIATVGTVEGVTGTAPNFIYPGNIPETMRDPGFFPIGENLATISLSTECAKNWALNTSPNTCP